MKRTSQPLCTMIIALTFGVLITLLATWCALRQAAHIHRHGNGMDYQYTKFVKYAQEHHAGRLGDHL